MATNSKPLREADHLSEYDVIVLDPAAVLGSATSGQIDEIPPGAYRQLSDELDVRSSELFAFFSNGGLLVAGLEPPAFLHAPGIAGFVDSYRWWWNNLGIWSASSDPKHYLTIGRGTSTQIEEPGHPAETYIRNLADYFVRISAPLPIGAVVLATSKAGDPIAVEVSVRDGAAILVPGGGALGGTGLRQLLARQLAELRFGQSADWQLKAEVAELEALSFETARIKEARDQSVSKLRGIRERKQRLLAIPAVQNVLTYYRKATAGTPTPEQTLPQLYKLVEQIEDRLGGPSAVSEKLGIPIATLKRLKRLASDPKYDIRHGVQEGEAQPIAPDHLAAAMSDAKGLVRAFLDHEFENL